MRGVAACSAEDENEVAGGGGSRRYIRKGW